MEKTCTACKLSKPTSEFNKNKAKAKYDGLSTECRICVNVANKARYAANKKYWQDRYHANRAADPEGFKEAQRQRSAVHRNAPTNTIYLRYLKKRYGITVEQYEAMLEDQGGVCAICRQKERGKEDVRLHVDHCHATGKVRALLCFSCNVGLGKFEDNPEWLREAAEYLKRFVDTTPPPGVSC